MQDESASRNKCAGQNSILPAFPAATAGNRGIGGGPGKAGSLHGRRHCVARRPDGWSGCKPRSG